MTLRERLASGRILVAPGVCDGLTAALAEAAGFEALYVSGAAVAYTRLGRPDIGLTTMSEMAEAVAQIRDRVALPLVVDADTGFGNALNAQRTMRAYERAGAGALQVEDQVFPKRCGHLRGQSADRGRRDGRQDRRDGRGAGFRRDARDRTHRRHCRGGAGARARPRRALPRGRRRRALRRGAALGGGDGGGGRAIPRPGAADGQHGRGWCDAAQDGRGAGGGRLLARHLPRRDRAGAGPDGGGLLPQPRGARHQRALRRPDAPTSPPWATAWGPRTCLRAAAASRDREGLARPAPGVGRDPPYGRPRSVASRPEPPMRGLVGAGVRAGWPAAPGLPSRAGPS